MVQSIQFGSALVIPLQFFSQADRKVLRTRLLETLGDLQREERTTSINRAFGLGQSGSDTEVAVGKSISIQAESAPYKNPSGNETQDVYIISKPLPHLADTKVIADEEVGYWQKLIDIVKKMNKTVPVLFLNDAHDNEGALEKLHGLNGRGSALFKLHRSA